MNRMYKTEKIKNGRNTSMILILLIVALVVAILILWYFSSGDDLKEGVVVVHAEGTKLGSLTLDDLEKLPGTEKTMTVSTSCGSGCSNSNSGGAGSGTADSEEGAVEHIYTGVLLKDVLDSIDPGLTSEYTKVITRGVDYYSQVIEMQDVQKPDEIYIVYKDNDKLLKTKDGRDGSLEMVVASDQYGKRFTNWLVSIELQ